MSDSAWIRRAIELARLAEGRTAPNPMVGAVVVRDGVMLAEGYHRAPGEDHAEPAALQKLKFKADGATLYVNLEPCCHHGRTPPCTDSILASGVRRVVVGMVDPNPLVSGKGIALLRAAGVEVEVGVEELACMELNAGYVKAIEKGLPQVWLKTAITLDGRIADAHGSSRWITGPDARREGHRYRDRLDAIMIGTGTLFADDPALTTRDVDGRDALPVILDSRLRTPVESRVLSAGRRPLVFCAKDAPMRELPADIVRVNRGEGGLEMLEVLRELASRGVHNLLVEGGGRLSRSLLGAGLVDRLLVFVAPKVLGGGPSFVSGPGFALAQAPEFRLVHTRTLGEDVLLELVARRGGAGCSPA